MKTDLSPLMENLLDAEQAGLLSDDIGRAVALSVRIGCAGRFEHEHLEKVMRDHRLELRMCPFLKPYGLGRGDFILGYDPTDKRPYDPKNGYRVPLEVMGSPGFICGGTGSGKSNTAKFWSCQFGVLCPGFWFIDVMKSEGRVVAEFLCKAGYSCSIVGTFDCRFNPLEVPPRVSPQSYVGTIADSLVRVLLLPPTARKVLHQLVYSLYAKRGMFQGNCTDYPTLFELYEDLRQSGKQFHASAREALLTALAPVLMELSPVLAFRKGWNVSDLSREKIIFEFNAGSEVAKNLLTNCCLILPTFQSRVAQGFSNAGREEYLAVYLDESSSLIEADDATISRWVGLVRGIGLVLLLSNQSAVSVSQRVLSNIPNRFLAQMPSYADLNVMASSSGIDRDQKQYLATHLKPGMLAAQLGNGEWRKPFLFTTPLMETGNRHFQGNGCKALDALPVVAAPEFVGWMPEWARTESISTPQDTPSQAASLGVANDAAVLSTETIDSDELRFLEAVASDPCQAVSFYPAKARLSKRKALRLRKSLVAKKMIQEQTMQSGRGRPSILLAVTDKGQALLQKQSSQGGP